VLVGFLSWWALQGRCSRSCCQGVVGSLADRKRLLPQLSYPHRHCQHPHRPRRRSPPPEGQKVEQVGTASWYGPDQQGKETASGDTFDQQKLTAAHPTLPLGTKAVITNLETGKSVQVTINDRGPYVKGRKIDLSRAAGQKIGMRKKGAAKVKIQAAVPRKPKKRVVRRATKTSKAHVAKSTEETTGSQQ